MNILGGLGIRIALVAVVAIGLFLFRDRLSGAANDLQVGDCFQEPAATVTIEDVQHTPCTDPHDNEVVFVGANPAAKGAPVLSDDAHQAWVATNCLPAFLSYTGTDLLTQEVLDMAWYVPADEAWAEGNRRVICYAYRLDGQKLTGSVRKR